MSRKLVTLIFAGYVFGIFISTTYFGSSTNFRDVACHSFGLYLAMQFFIKG